MIINKLLNLVLMPLFCATGCTPYVPPRAEPLVMQSAPIASQKPPLKAAAYASARTKPPFKLIPASQSVTIVVDPGHGGMISAPIPIAGPVTRKNSSIYPRHFF